MRRFVMAAAAVGALVAALAGVSSAQAKKATLTLSDGSIAAGIGFSWGKGTLAYAGKTYPVKVEGLSVGEVGITRATAVAVMKNQNGVVIELQSTTQGASLKLGAEGLRLTLAN
jgi:hypothetical protein